MVGVEKQGHLVVKLQREGIWKENETVFLVTEERAPKTRQIDKRSPPAGSIKQAGKKEKNVKKSEQDNPEEIEIVAVKVPIVEVKEKPVVAIETTEERIAAEIKPVPHKKLGVEKSSDGGKSKPESIKYKDNWNEMWAKLRKMVAKTEEVETRIKETQRRSSSLKESMKKGQTTNVPAEELAVKTPKERPGVKVPDPRKEVGSCEEKVEEDLGEFVRGVSLEKKEMDGQKCEYSMTGTKRFLDAVTKEVKRTPDVARRKDKDVENIKSRDKRKDKTSEPPEEEEMKTPRKHVKESSWRTENSRPDVAAHALNVAKEQRGEKWKEKREKNRRWARERSEKNRVKVGKIRGRKDRCTIGLTEEENGPPDKNCQNYRKSEEGKEGTIIGGEDKREEMAEREEIVGELMETIKRAEAKSKEEKMAKKSTLLRF